MVALWKSLLTKHSQHVLQNPSQVLGLLWKFQSLSAEKRPLGLQQRCAVRTYRIP